MKRLLFFLAIFISLLPVFAQTDSDLLEEKIKSASETEKVKIYNQLAAYSLKVDPGKAIQYASQSLILIKQLTDDRIKISHHKLTLGREELLATDFSRYEADAHNMMGEAYYVRNQYPKAVKQYKSALEISENAQYEEGKKAALENLVIIDETLKAENAEGKAKWDKALRNKIESLKLGQKLEDKTHRLSLVTLEKIAAIYERKNNYTRAVEFHLKTLPYLEASNNTATTADKFNHIADLYKEIGNYKDALKYYDLAIKAKEEAGDTLGVVSSLNNVQTIYDDLKAYDKKINKSAKTDSEFLRNEKAVENKVVITNENSYKTLSENFAERGDYKKSLEYFKLYAALKDKMLAETKNRQIEMLEAEFLLKNKSKEIELLQKQKQIHQLDLNKKELELTRRNNFIYTLLVGLAVLLGLVIMAKRHFKIKKKAHQQLQEAYKNLEQTHNQLKQTQAQLVQAEKMASLGQLTAGIAHEINNPINFVSANIQPLKDDVADVMEVLHTYEKTVKDQGLSNHFKAVEDLKESLEIDYLRGEIQSLLKGIEEGAGRTKNIVKGLRIFSRLDESDIKLFDVHEGLDSTLTLLHNKFSDRITVTKQYGILPLAEGFPGKMNQVFMNILNNAIHAIPDKGQIFIQTQAIEKNIRISIRDTGIGMTEEVKNRIFEPFFTTKEVGVGTGLGLAISFGIIEQHQGRIQVNSAPGKGTEFVITLPVKQ